MCGASKNDAAPTSPVTNCLLQLHRQDENYCADAHTKATLLSLLLPQSSYGKTAGADAAAAASINLANKRRITKACSSQIKVHEVRVRVLSPQTTMDSVLAAGAFFSQV